MSELAQNKDYLALKQLAYDLQCYNIAMNEKQKANNNIEEMKKNKAKYLPIPNSIDFNDHSNFISYADNVIKKTNKKREKRFKANKVFLSIFLLLISLATLAGCVFLGILFQNSCIESTWGMSACDSETVYGYHVKFSVFYMAGFVSFALLALFCFFVIKKKYDWDALGNALFAIFILLTVYAFVRYFVHVIIVEGGWGILEGFLSIFIMIFSCMGRVMASIGLLLVLGTITIFTLALIFVLIPNIYEQKISTIASASERMKNAKNASFEENKICNELRIPLKICNELKNKDIALAEQKKLEYCNIFEQNKPLYAKYEAEFNSQILQVEKVKDTIAIQINAYQRKINNNTCLHSTQKNLEHVYKLLCLFELRQAETIVHANNRLIDLNFMKTISNEISSIKNAVSQLVKQQNVIITQNNTITKLIYDTQKTIKDGFAETNYNLTTINHTIKESTKKIVSELEKQTKTTIKLYNYIKYDW